MKKATSLSSHKQKCVTLLGSLRKITGQIPSQSDAAATQNENQQKSPIQIPNASNNEKSLPFDSKLLRDIHTEQNREMNKLKKMMSEINSAEEQQRGFREILEKFVDYSMSDQDHKYDLSSFEVIKKQVLYFLDKFHSLVCSYYNSYEICNSDKT